MVGEVEDFHSLRDFSGLSVSTFSPSSTSAMNFLFEQGRGVCTKKDWGEEGAGKLIGGVLGVALGGSCDWGTEYTPVVGGSVVNTWYCVSSVPELVWLGGPGSDVWCC